MPVADSGIKTDRVSRQFLIQHVNQVTRLFRADMPGGMIFDAVILDANQIAAHRHVARRKLNAHAGGFENAAPFINVMHVIAQHAEIGDIARGRHVGGNGDELPGAAFRAQGVHIRRVGGHQWRLPAEPLNRFIRHAVAKNNQIFHNGNFTAEARRARRKYENAPM